MNKIVPDPPRAIISKTAAVAFGHCKAHHLPMFSVRSEIDAEDALVHASLLLKGIYDTLQQSTEFAEHFPQGGPAFLVDVLGGNGQGPGGCRAGRN